MSRLALFAITAALIMSAISCRDSRSSVVDEDGGVDATASEDQTTTADSSADSRSDADDRPDAIKPPPPPSCAPCTDLTLCCAPEEIACVGDPDKGVVCTCARLWSCDKEGCEQPMPQPNESNWTCHWTTTEYGCTQPGVAAAAPEIDPDSPMVWSCDYDEAGSLWACSTQSPPNPCNAAAPTAWSCTVDNAAKMLTCSGGFPTPTTCGTWSCGPDGCNRTDQSGLPTPGDSWTCHQAKIEGKQQWICRGPAPSPPGGETWSCQLAAVGAYRCTSDVDTTCVPDGTKQWACYRGSAFGGLRCEELPENSECFAGQKRWCDPLSTGGWGLVTCRADGTWPSANGQLDCAPTASGAVPATACACYHFFFNPDCCERADCVVPAGGSQQFCPPSGGKACEPCLPMSPTCSTPGAICAISNTMETYCADPCDTGCPPDFDCLPVKSNNEITNVCIPLDYSCYY